MKINIAFPTTGAQKTFEFEDEKKLRAFMDQRMAAEVPADELGDQFKGYILKITGGNDKQGFPMKQGVATNTRVRLLLDGKSGCFVVRKKGERRKKSVRGCITGADLAVIHCVIVRKGEEDIPGLTDTFVPRRLGPKRASKIRKLFSLSKDDDVRKYVVKREFVDKKGKKRVKSPKIQRLVTPVTLQRWRRKTALRKKAQLKSKSEALAYAKLLKQRSDESKAKAKSRKSSRRSVKEEKPVAPKTAPVKTTPATKAPAGGKRVPK